MNSDVTQAELKELLNYDPDTGVFKWRVSPRMGISVGTNAGCLSSWGYLIIRIKGKPYRAHRLAWLYVYGEWPEGELDHINHDRIHNRIENLRIVSRFENSRNQKMRTNNTSGVTGVYWNKVYQKWYAYIQLRGKLKYLGRSTDKQVTIEARKTAEKKYGFHPNHGLSDLTI